MIALDTSAVVALFANWHEGHETVLAAVRDADDLRLPEHAALETYSLLTRLPPPHRMAAGPVLTLLESWFSGPWLGLDPEDRRRLLREARDLGLTGGAIYDALVGSTARQAGAKLLSRDRRAAAVYRSLGVNHELVF